MAKTEKINVATENPEAKTGNEDGGGETKFIGRMKSGTFSNTTADTTTETTTDGTTTEGTTTTATTTPEPKQTKRSTTAPPVKRAKGYEDVPPADTKEIVKEVVSQVLDAKKEKEAAEQEPELTAEEKEILPVLAELERLYPDKYKKGMADRAKASVPKFEKFEKEWRESNPDADADEWARAEDKFRKDNGTWFDEKDFEKAEKSVATRPIQDDVKSLKEELAALKATKHQENIAPVAQSNAFRAGAEVANEIGLADALGENGRFDTVKLDAMRDDDPIRAEIMIGAVAEARHFADAATKLFAGVDHELQPMVAQEAVRAERAILELPEEDQTDQHGRPFVPYAEYLALPPKKRVEVWTMSAENLIPIFNKSLADRTKGEIEAVTAKLSKSAAKLGFKKDEAPVTQTATATTKTAKPATVTGKDGVVDTGTKGADQGSGSKFLSRMKTGTIR